MRGQQVQAWKNTVGHGALWYKMVENWTGIGALGCADTLQKNWLADAGFDDAVIVENLWLEAKAVAYQIAHTFSPPRLILRHDLFILKCCILTMAAFKFT